MNLKKLLTAAILLPWGWHTTQAKITLPEILSDNMVLQQQTDARLWGWSDPNADITIKTSWSSKTYQTKADKNGKWLTAVPTPEAGYTAYTIEISDGTPVTLSNVLIGEVWFCSGQSNMEMPLAGFDNCPIEDANEEIAFSSRWKGIRVATISRDGRTEPADRCTGKWETSCPQNAPRFSATAFFFAQTVNKVLDIPVGIINCSWGGSSVEGWLPKEIVSTYPDIDLERDIRKVQPGDWWHWTSPTIMYNGMLKPLQNYTVKGFLWYQGEANVGKHQTYAERLKTMVDLWRKEWGLGELPFYFVEIAPFGNGEGTASAFLREAQHKAESIITNCAMVSTNDLVEPYEATNIHPKDKKHVGERLAFQALTKTYHIQGIKADSPSYRSMTVEGNAAILDFIHADNGFNRMNGMTGFEMAGEDRVFYPAQAELRWKNQIKVTCDKVEKPVAVRYGFRDFLPGNVADLHGLPLIPFRTDNWE